jgi:SAM-dependent methyltransferase
LWHAGHGRDERPRLASVVVDARDWDERYAGTELVWSAEPNRFVAEQVAGLHPGTAVDLGSGEGRNAIHLARLGWTVTAVDFSRVALDKGRTIAGDLPVDWVCADATTWRASEPVELVVVAYLQLERAARRAAVANAFAALEVGGTFLLVGHDSTNLTEGTGGPQDARVLMTSDDVLGDLDATCAASGASYDVVMAGRVARPVAEAGHQHEQGASRVAWDCLVRVVRTG